MKIRVGEICVNKICFTQEKVVVFDFFLKGLGLLSLENTYLVQISREIGLHSNELSKIQATLKWTNHWRTAS